MRHQLPNLAFLLVLAPASARAQTPEGKGELDVRADEVSVDTRLLELELKGNVHADAPPFHLSSEALKLKRTPIGVVVDGDGRLAFCPCLGTPLTIAFSGATVAPPGDLILRSPRLLVFGLPVFWLPVFWLRSSSRVGVLPPDVAWRGADGMYLGGGLHLPWTKGDPSNGVDVRAGGYFKGGFAASVDLTTPSSFTRVQFDRLAGSTLGGDQGVIVDARGAIARRSAATSSITEELAWDADLLRGARGLYATTDLETVARPADHLAVETRARTDDFIAAVGIRSTARRGGELGSLDVIGPMMTLGASHTLGDFGATSLVIDGGALRIPGGTTVSLARAVMGASTSAHLGAIGSTLSVQAAGDVVSDGATHAKDGAAAARWELGVPIGRAFRSGDTNDPWRHRLEPLAFASTLLARGDGGLAAGARGGVAAGGGLATLRGDAFTTGGGFRTALAKWARGEGFEIEASAGATYAKPDRRTDAAPDGVFATVRWRAEAQGRYYAVAAEGAHLISALRGDAWVARARVGETTGISLKAWVASRVGIDPVTARLLTDPSLEAPVGFLEEGGWTGGARASIPWFKYVTTRGGVDVDFTERSLIAAVGTLEIKDSCGCFRFRATGAHRMGREGIDVWIGVDVTPEMARR